MLYATALIAVSFAGYVSATLPPQTDEAQAKAAEAAAKVAWSDKVALYQLCLAMDRTAEAYRSGLLAEGKDAPAPVETAPCVDPGPYGSQVTPIASKPLEAATAHSPPGTVTSPPSTNAPAAEISAGAKE